MDTYLLAEEAFVGIQGEGKYQGTNSLFIRFYGCNLRCTLCDSRYAVDSKEETLSYTEDEIINLVHVFEGHIVFTGGEPLLGKYQTLIFKLIDMFPNKFFEIETNGSLELMDEKYFEYENVIFNISPKNNIDQDDGVSVPGYYLLEQIQTIQNPKFDYIVKILFNSIHDFTNTKIFIDSLGVRSSKVYFQPISIEGDNSIRLAKRYIDIIVQGGYNLSLRLHTILFDNKRGV